MDKLLDLLKGAAPALAAAVVGPAGPAVLTAIAGKLGTPPIVSEMVKTLEANPEAAAKLREIDLKEFEIEQANVSDRWKADMSSDSWLSKNIRPLTLVYILTAYLVMALLDGYGIHIAEAYVTLLGQWGMLVMSAYFGGRTLEKILDKKGK